MSSYFWNLRNLLYLIKGTGKMRIKGVLWHDTGANNPNLKRYVQPSDDAPDRTEWLERLGKNPYNNDWNHAARKAGMNCWILSSRSVKSGALTAL